jgi:hypothetical protein
MSNNYAIQELVKLRSEVDRIIRNLTEQDAEAGGDLLAEPLGSHRAADEAERRPAQRPDEFPRDPLAKSMADLVTPKQLGMIRALARNAALDPDQECQSVMKCKTEELSKRAASTFIDHLKRCEAEFQQPRRAS